MTIPDPCLFAIKELRPYDWWLIVSERLWVERVKILSAMGGVPKELLEATPSTLSNIQSYKEHFIKQ